VTTGADDEPTTFGALLRQHRNDAGLTQEALAERAEMSVRGIQDLERGITRPLRDTLRRLSAAFALSDAARAQFAQAGFPAPRRRAAAPAVEETAAISAVSLPTFLTPLIGRRKALAAIVSLLKGDANLAAESSVRLLTLTGPGGIGKTRVAAQVAADLAGYFPDGVTFVALASIRDPHAVPVTIAKALGLREEASRSPIEQIGDALRDRRHLMVLDNFEQVGAAAPVVATVLAACPLARFLVTSRAALRVRGEYEFPIAPLAVPQVGPSAWTDDGMAEDYPAVALFVERARMVRPDFELTPALVPLIAEICVRLDGLPLAIELAAARIKYFSPAALLGRLEQRLPLLAGGARDLPERQQTMRNAIAWSYDLLDPREQALFRRLSVFDGGCDFRAIEAICAPVDAEDSRLPMPGEPGSHEDLLAGIASLVDNSLLVPEPLSGGSDGDERMRMLQTIREYGIERLEESGEAQVLCRRHAFHYQALAERAESEMTGPQQTLWLDRLEQEHDNLRAALHWAQTPRARSDERARLIGIRIAGALWRFWYVRGYLREGSGRLEAVLDPTASPDPSLVLAKVLYGAGVLALEQRDYTRAVALGERCLAMSTSLGDERTIVAALNVLSLAARDRGDYTLAGELQERCLVQARHMGNPHDIALILTNIGILSSHLGDYGRAAELYEESLSQYQGSGNDLGIATSLTNLAEALRFQGVLARSKDLYRQSLALHRQVGNKVGVAGSLDGLGMVARLQGNAIGAAILCGAASALRERIGVALSPVDEEHLSRELTEIELVTGSDVFITAWAAGQALTPDEAIAAHAD
jgi:predicted ATPase/transcriptional regulator with XRE-family HTH domain